MRMSSSPGDWIKKKAASQALHERSTDGNATDGHWGRF
jgi:hypothetical protein